MLTAQNIAERARAISPVVDKSNYRVIADQIHPPIKGIKRIDSDDGREYETPEWREYNQKNIPTVDWVDVVVGIVLGRQWYATLRRLGLG